MKSILAWWRQRRINKLLVERAGLTASIAADERAKLISAYSHKKLAEVETKLLQLQGPIKVGASVAYNELIYAVAIKHPGETRHQTALRYIQEREALASAPGVAKEAK